MDFDGRSVDYDWSEADQLVLAYAVSVHKAQGSEFPAVVIPLVTAHYMMLQRNLLYTAVTRAKSLCVLVGSRRAIGIAVKNDKIAHRYTALDWRLAGEAENREYEISRGTAGIRASAGQDLIAVPLGFIVGAACGRGRSG